MLWEKEAQEKLMHGRISVPLTVYYSDLVWTNPNNPNQKKWRIIASDSGDRPDWFFTGDEDLTSLGTKFVELYRNNYMQVCVRKVRKG